jgi:hypothetical protein
MKVARFLAVLAALCMVALVLPYPRQSGTKPAAPQSCPASPPPPHSRPASPPPPHSRPASPSPSELEARYQAALDDLGAPADDKRAAAIEVLRAAVEPCRDQLLKALKSPEWWVRHSVLRIYRMQPDPEVAGQVAALLFDENAEVREQAVLAVTGLQPEGWTDQLAQLLWRETDARVLRQVLCGLGEGKDLEVVPPILDFLERTTEDYLRKRAGAALRSLSGEDFGTDASKWRRWWSERDRDG